MAASQLGTYNKALRHLEERQLLNLTENREPRRLLDAEWSDAILMCLQSGYFRFSIRQVMASPDSASTPNFGRKYSYTKPSDWIRTYQVSPDDRFLLLDRDYADQNNVWYSDLPYFYVRYVSNDPNFGLNMALWPMAFTEYLGCYLAYLISPRLAQSKDKVDTIEKRLKRFKAEAVATDAMDAPPGKIPPGTWVQSRTPRGSITPLGGGWDEY